MSQDNKDDKSLLTEDTKGNEFMELVKIALWAVLLATIIRSFFFEPFNIPSGSMKPTLLVGDYIFVTKYKYGYSKYSFPFSPEVIEGRVGSDTLPKRGAVVVFRNPQQNNIDYIKRIVGMPGERIQVRDGRLYINDQIVPREFVERDEVTTPMGTKAELLLYRETLPNGLSHMIYEESDAGSLDNTREFLVPEGHYFVMGDNRDNSKDSRVYEEVGPIPLDHIIGPANYVFFSTDGGARLWEVWNWPFATRFSRLFTPIQASEEGASLQ